MNSFGQNGQSGLRLDDPDSLTRSDRLNVVYSQATNVGEFQRDQLFGGFERMRALTYTSSIPMIVSLIQDFDYEKFECVFGHGGILSRDATAILSFQSVVDEKLNRQFVAVSGNSSDRLKSIYDKNAQGDLRFFVVKDAIAHAKIYLLEDDERRRVIVGSANLSETAFSGRQAETLVVFDNDETAWDHFVSQYESVKAVSTSDIPLREKPLLAEKSPIQETPALKDVSQTEAPVDLYVPSENQLEAEFNPPSIMSQVERVIKIRRPALSELRPDKRGIVNITANKISEVIRISTSNKPVEEASLWLTYDGSRFIFSDDDMPLDAEPDDIRTDIAAWIEFFSNYENGFVGDVPRLQHDYFTFMCWFFFSPLMCDLRNKMIGQNRYSFDHPTFAVLYGESNCGKSVLLRTLMESMFSSYKFIETSYFTRTYLRGLQEQFKRFPVVCDDVTRDRFNRHAPEIIKDESVPSAEYPCFALSMNADTRNFQPEIVKRCLMIYTRTSLPGDNTEARRRLQESVTDISDRMSTALYREYLRRAVERLDAVDSGEHQAEDVLKLSSSILCELFKEYKPRDTRLPDWCKPMSLDDYQNRAWDRPKLIMQRMLHRDRYTSQRSPGEGQWTLSGDLVLYGVPIMGSTQIKNDIPGWILEETATVPGLLALKLDAVESFGVPIWRSRNSWQFWRRWK